MVDEAAIGRIFRAESGRSVAALIGFLGDIVAEDAVQEAFAIALRMWPAAGLPPNPGGWITRTARNCAIDRLRREARGRDLLGEMAALATDADPGEATTVPDDRLRLIFTCCGPPPWPRPRPSATSSPSAAGAPGGRECREGGP